MSDEKKVRNRIKDLRQVPAGELKADPRNWRQHPHRQQAALRMMLDRVGYVDAVIAREDDDGNLILVDGHLRAALDPTQKVPVLVVDLDEAEAGEVLATLDPLAAMARADTDMLQQLLETLSDQTDEAMGELLNDLHWDPTKLDPQDEWEGMPEFEQEADEPYRSITVHLLDEQAVQDFVQRLGLEITETSRFAYYPKAPPRMKTTATHLVEGGEDAE